MPDHRYLLWRTRTRLPTLARELRPLGDMPLSPPRVAQPVVDHKLGVCPGSVFLEISVDEPVSTPTGQNRTFHPGSDKTLTPDSVLAVSH